MKGILPLFFVSVTVYLAEGNFYSRPNERDQYQESEPYQFRDDWNAIRGDILKKLDEEMKNGKKGPLTTLGEALLDTVVLLLTDSGISTRSDEGQPRAYYSNLGFRDSSSSSGKEMSSSGVLLVLSSPVNTSGIMLSQSTKTENDKCFIRNLIDAINLIVTNAYEEVDSQGGLPPSGPKMLHLLVNELNEGLESVEEIDLLDKTLFKATKLIRRILSGLIADLKSSYAESDDMKKVLEFLTEIEVFIDGVIQANRELADAGKKDPAIRILFDQVEDELEDLANGTSDSDGLPEFRKFIKQLRSVLRILILGKGSEGSEMSLLNEVLFSTKTVIGEIVEDLRLMDNEPGSINSLLVNVISELHSHLMNHLRGKKVS